MLLVWSRSSDTRCQLNLRAGCLSTVMRLRAGVELVSTFRLARLKSCPHIVIFVTILALVVQHLLSQKLYLLGYAVLFLRTGKNCIGWRRKYGQAGTAAYAISVLFASRVDKGSSREVGLQDQL